MNFAFTDVGLSVKLFDGREAVFLDVLAKVAFSHIKVQEWRLDSTFFSNVISSVSILTGANATGPITNGKDI